jgi:hypothetical protein
LGDRIFPDTEAMFGDLIDVFFGLWGAFLVVIAYETAAMSLRPHSRIRAAIWLSSKHGIR